MRTWHLKSWSAQAREMANRRFGWIAKTLEGEKTLDEIEKEVVKFFDNSYRHQLIRYRAAKRYGRMIRKIKKNS